MCMCDRETMHMFVCLCVPGHVGVDREAAIEEDDDPQDRGGDEELGVDSQPGEIQTYLLPKVFPVEEGLIHSYSLRFHQLCPFLLFFFSSFSLSLFSVPVFPFFYRIQ